jgi:precorrin-6B methylase 2
MTLWGQYDTTALNVTELKSNPNVQELPRGEMYLAVCNHILRSQYGFVRSADEQRPIDGRSRPLPLYTYPAIEFLTQFDYSGKRVFEFGAGSSTLFWMERAARVVSVENDRSWYERLKPVVRGNVELRLEEGDGYPFCIESSDETFDVIIIDGAGYRYDCAALASRSLTPGGVIVLDNADWYPRSAELLRQAQLLQVDMSGFKPTESHTSTTSLFFDRRFDFPTLGVQRPAFAMGAKQTHSTEWDKPYAKRPSG